MLSKEQASRIAQDLLDQAEAVRIERLDAAVLPIGWYWSCPELNLLAQHQRGDIVEQAKVNVTRYPISTITYFIAFAGFLGACYCLLGRSPVHRSDAAFVIAIGRWHTFVILGFTNPFIVKWNNQ